MIVRSMLAGLSIAGLLAAAAPAFAGPALSGEAASAPTPGITKLDLRKGETVAVLATPLKSPKDPVIDGRIWHCEADTCRVSPLSTAHAEPLGRECADAAKMVGAFTSYQTGADTVDGEALAKCNTSARKG
jgi:hypothetical protein